MSMMSMMSEAIHSKAYTIDINSYPDVCDVWEYPNHPRNLVNIGLPGFLSSVCVWMVITYIAQV